MSVPLNELVAAVQWAGEDQPKRRTLRALLPGGEWYDFETVSERSLRLNSAVVDLAASYENGKSQTLMLALSSIVAIERTEYS